MKNIVVGLLAGIFFFSSCDNEVDINAPWRETPVVFAILDLNEDTQVFRIQKTYQNGLNQTSSEVAQVADSLYLKNISVQLINNNIKDTVSFAKSAPQKLPGFFSNKDSSYWSLALSKAFLNKSSTYTLLITNKETGKTYRAVSNIVDTAIINRAPTYNPITIDLANVSNARFGIYVENTGNNAAIVDVLLRLNYTEAPAANPSQTALKSLDYIVIQSTSNTGQGVVASASVGKENYRDFIKNSFKTDASIVRKFVSVEIVVVAANSDYADMLQTNKPSGSIIPKVGQYSNVSDAIGIFGSRTITTKAQVMNNASIDLINNSLLNP